MALSPRANAAVGPPKDVASSANQITLATAYPPSSSSLHNAAVRSSDLAYSSFPTFGSLFQDLGTQTPPLKNLKTELLQEGSKPPHNFFSLYNDSSSDRAEARSNKGVSTYLTTQDFLRPLERGDKGIKTPPMETSAAAASSVEHVLPGGIGTYSIRHISSQCHTNGKSEPPVNSVVHGNAVGQPEGPRGNTYGGGAFTLWEERFVVDGGRISDDLVESDITKDYLEKSGYRLTTVRSKAAISDLTFHEKASFNLSSGETNQQPRPASSKQREYGGQGFVEMMKSTKALSEDDDDEDDEYLDRGRENRKEVPSHKGEAPAKGDGKNSDQRVNNPRSKHSATEQRRRSKINDRFQTLRNLVPHGDQKRDKASFLLEVIEYIQLLQEKVRRYETTEKSWNQERMKTIIWDICKKGSGLGEAPVDSSQTVASTLLQSKQNCELRDSNRSRLRSAAKHDETSTATAGVLPNPQNLPEPNKNDTIISVCASSNKGKESTGVFNKPIPLTFSMQQCAYPPYGNSVPHSLHPTIQVASEKQCSPDVQGIKSGCEVMNGCSFEEKKSSESAAPIPLPHFERNNATVVKTVNGLENLVPDQNSSQLSSIQHDTGWNQGTLLKDQATDTKSGTKLELLHPNAYFDSSTRAYQSVSQSDSEPAARQLQRDTFSSDQPRKNYSQQPVTAQEKLAIQGGIINVSSVYSKGLLDTLTKALQSSGLDLSQANISVQIDLGRQGGTSMATSNVKEHGNNRESSSENPKLQGQSRAADTTGMCEKPQKRPKIEKDL